MLYEHPRMGRVVPEFNQQDLHEMVVPPYRIIYRVNEVRKAVPVSRFWQGKMLLDSRGKI